MISLKMIEELKRLDKAATPGPVLVGKRGVMCPFCGEDDFDLIGLKHHFERGWCDRYNETSECIGLDPSINTPMELWDHLPQIISCLEATPEQLAEKLRAIGWRVQPPIDQKTCKHLHQTGSGGIGSDGSGFSSWYCSDCGASGRTEWPANKPPPAGVGLLLNPSAASSEEDR